MTDEQKKFFAKLRDFRTFQILNSEMARSDDLQIRGLMVNLYTLMTIAHIGMISFYKCIMLEFLKGIFMFNLKKTFTCLSFLGLLQQNLLRNQPRDMTIY